MYTYDLLIDIVREFEMNEWRYFSRLTITTTNDVNKVSGPISQDLQYRFIWMLPFLEGNKKSIISFKRNHHIPAILKSYQWKGSKKTKHWRKKRPPRIKKSFLLKSHFLDGRNKVFSLDCYQYKASCSTSQTFMACSRSRLSKFTS